MVRAVFERSPPEFWFPLRDRKADLTAPPGLRLESSAPWAGGCSAPKLCQRGPGDLGPLVSGAEQGLCWRGRGQLWERSGQHPRKDATFPKITAGKRVTVGSISVTKAQLSSKQTPLERLMVSGGAQGPQVAALSLGRQEGGRWGRPGRGVPEERSVSPQPRGDHQGLLASVSNFFLYFYVLIYVFEYITCEDMWNILCMSYQKY